MPNHSKKRSFGQIYCEQSFKEQISKSIDLDQFISYQISIASKSDIMNFVKNLRYQNEQDNFYYRNQYGIW